MSSPDERLIYRSLADRHHVAFGGSDIELARAKEPRFRVSDHLIPLGDPADGARHGKDRRDMAGGSLTARKMMPE